MRGQHPHRQRGSGAHARPGCAAGQDRQLRAPPGGPHERTAIQLNFSLPAEAASVEVYRKPFGGYSQYDENGGVTPALPATLPAPGWTLTAVTASGQTDEPPVRDYWYYALVTKDAYANPSVVSNLTAGTLDYHLGDVHDGTAECAGDDQVTLADVGFLGAHYGEALPVNGALRFTARPCVRQTVIPARAHFPQGSLVLDEWAQHFLAPIRPSRGLLNYFLGLVFGFLQPMTPSLPGGQPVPHGQIARD